MIPTHMFRYVLGAALVASIAACGDATTSVKSRPGTPANLNASPGATLVECPVDTTTQVTSLVTPLGGTLSTGGTTVTIPAGAVLVPTYITLTVPASNYMEVDISVPGASTYTFQSPITVAISYARCSRENINKAPLSVYYIDSATKALLQSMGGTDDKAARTVTFSTPHLSGYAIAN